MTAVRSMFQTIGTIKGVESVFWGFNARGKGNLNVVKCYSALQFGFFYAKTRLVLRCRQDLY